MPPLTRRRLLALGGAAGAALAGCAGTATDDPYTDWLPARDTFVTASIDLTLSERRSHVDPYLPLVLPGEGGESGESLVPDLGRLDRIEDPLLRFPLQTGGRILGLSMLSLSVAGLGYLVDPERPARGVTELFLAGDVLVGTGDVDVARADQALRSGSPGPFGENLFTPVGETGSVAYYELSGTDVRAAVAVSEDAVLVGDTRARVEAVVAAKAGDGDRATDENATADWLFDTAGGGDVQVGWLGPVDLGRFAWDESADGVAPDAVPTSAAVFGSARFAPDDGTVTADFALEGGGDAAPPALAEQLGSATDGSSVTVRGDRVTASATYAGDAVDLDFVTAEPTPGTTVPRGTALPGPVAEAVPSGAFSFEHDPEAGSVRVNFEKSFAADRVLVRTLESGWESSTSTPGPTSYLTVYAASGGDTVEVVVTVDGESGVVASETVPPSSTGDGV